MRFSMGVLKNQHGVYIVRQKVRKALETVVPVVLGNGNISKALKISAHRFTKSAREKIEKAGGAITVIGA